MIPEIERVELLAKLMLAKVDTDEKLLILTSTVEDMKKQILNLKWRISSLERIEENRSNNL
jgi:hypothetical protein